MKKFSGDEFVFIFGTILCGAVIMLISTTKLTTGVGLGILSNTIVYVLYMLIYKNNPIDSAPN